jgi:hypothetical protein
MVMIIWQLDLQLHMQSVLSPLYGSWIYNYLYLSTYHHKRRGVYPFLEFSVMLIICVSNLGPLSVISYFLMKITIERLIEMYMMYAMPWKCGSN